MRSSRGGRRTARDRAKVNGTTGRRQAAEAGRAGAARERRGFGAGSARVRRGIGAGSARVRRAGPRATVIARTRSPAELRIRAPGRRARASGWGETSEEEESPSGPHRRGTASAPLGSRAFGWRAVPSWIGRSGSTLALEVGLRSRGSGVSDHRILGRDLLRPLGRSGSRGSRAIARQRSHVHDARACPQASSPSEGHRSAVPGTVTLVPTISMLRHPARCASYRSRREGVPASPPMGCAKIVRGRFRPNPRSGS
jgi:hypothetical protein